MKTITRRVKKVMALVLFFISFAASPSSAERLDSASFESYGVPIVNTSLIRGHQVTVDYERMFAGCEVPVLTVDQLVKKYKTVDRICKWIESNIEYKSDSEVWGVGDYWQTAEETLRLKTGDCEDFAILAYECLKSLGIEAKLIDIKTNKRGHVICVFKRGGLWSYFSSGGLKDYRTENYRDLLRYAAAGWIFYAEVDTKGDVIFS